MTKRNDYKQGIEGILEHVEILKDNVASIEAPVTTIATESDAEKTIAEVKKLQQKIISYQKTAQALKNLLIQSC